MIDWGELQGGRAEPHMTLSPMLNDTIPASTPTLIASQGFYVLLLSLQAYWEIIRYLRGAIRKHRDSCPVCIVPRKPPPPS